MAASYPTSVKVFTSRNAGDVIQPAHVNDLQDEVNAIEAGLLNGTAGLNSSRSTVATLSVLGNSTINGNFQVSGVSAFTGNMTVTAQMSVSGALSAAAGFSIGAVQTVNPASTGNTNDLAVSSLTGILRLNVTGDSTLTGLSMGARDGQLLLISNVGGGSLKISHQDAASLSSNRFICPNSATLTVRTNGAIWTWYDNINGWFRLLGI